MDDDYNRLRDLARAYVKANWAYHDHKMSSDPNKPSSTDLFWAELQAFLALASAVLSEEERAEHAAKHVDDYVGGPYGVLPEDGVQIHWSPADDEFHAGELPECDACKQHEPEGT